MDILQKKDNLYLNDKIKQLLKALEFDNNKIEIKGSSSIASQYYFSDYDFFSKINKKYNSKEAYKYLKQIINNIKDNHIIVEIKLQTLDNEKTRYTEDKFKYDENFIKAYKNIDFIKIDAISYIDNRFIEISCIYKFADDNITSDEYKKNILEDIKELTKEGNYYKVLKRKFSIYKIDQDKDAILKLTEIFNSDLGKEYQRISNLEAIRLLIDNTDDDLILKKIVLNLKDIGEEPNIMKIDKNIKKYKAKLNKEAKKLNKHFIL